MIKKFTLNALFALTMVLSAAFASQTLGQVLVNYDFNAATTACTASSTFTATGVTSTFTTSETTCLTSAGTATNSRAFVQNTVAGSTTGFNNSSATPSKFFQFNLTGLPVGQTTNYQVFFQSQRSGTTGFTTITAQYSTDGGATFIDFGTQTVGATFATSTPDVFTIPFTVANTPNLAIRLVATGATATGGTVRIDNFQVRANAPTAGTVNIGGRVSNARGRGIARATVTLTDGEGNVRTALTDYNGFYKIENAAAGQTVILNARARGYNFTEPTQVVSLGEDRMTVNFSAHFGKGGE